jgi:chromosome segregation ATPase
MTITTEQAEQMAEICDQLGGFAQCAAALRSLAAERDDLAKRLKDAERERNHQHGRADRNAAQYAAEQAKREQLQAEIEKLREALKECADDLEAEIKHRHGDWVPKYPRERLKRDQDMAPVIKARAALGEKE